ncbi:MAG: redox-sensing transcriptional repressor Rex [Anaerolineales bacterium]|nr:redox-sensing transcriptional repressor Rex [Anaerolineales bacterium]
MADQVPDIVVARLPIYLRSLRHMDTEGRSITSSKELANILGTSAAQIRKDLSHFGEFGKQGTGYHVSFLINQLERILQADKVWDVALVGVGDLGHALLNNRGMERRGFRIVAAFDTDAEKIGTRVGNVIIQNITRMQEEISRANIKLAIVAVSAPSAQQAAESLVEAGVKCILNYSPIALTVPNDIRVQYIDPVTHLQHMSFYL